MEHLYFALCKACFIYSNFTLFVHRASDLGQNSPGQKEWSESLVD